PAGAPPTISRAAPDCACHPAACSRRISTSPDKRAIRGSWPCSTSCSMPTPTRCPREPRDGSRLMRPVELVMQGFGPFRDRVTVDFADADLIAIVGATGHGKSSIIDAMCFALYGRVPRHGDKDIAPVITLGAAEAQVTLTFTLGDRRYIAFRVV